jgi:hypothetical protein
MVSLHPTGGGGGFIYNPRDCGILSAALDAAT